jgi:argininosuccinate lyase
VGGDDRGGTEPPEGYLGATARIRKGPAPEMLAAGYRLEMADAPLLHDTLTLADLAHVLMLGEQGVIPPDHQSELLGALLQLMATPVGEFDYDARWGDAYNARERWLEQRIGRAAGWLAAGRPRREAGRIAFRLALRRRVLVLTEAVARFISALVEGAARHAGVLMPDYTYLQVAQPTTFGHYLLSFAEPAGRDAERLREAHGWVSRSPAGLGGVAGSRFPLDRQRLAALLGFDGLVEHTRDAMWQTDGLVSLVSAASLVAVNASRLAEDLEIYTSAEFGFVTVGDEFCRASVLMPQKRNPYALAVIRGGAGTLIGRSTGLAVTQRTPSARTDNLLHAYGEVCGSVELAAGVVDLAAAVTESLVVDEEMMGRRAREGPSQATDLAEAITLATGLDYRSSYRVVGRAVAQALQDGTGSFHPAALDPATLDRAAREVLGEPLTVPPELVADALDPAAAIRTRTVPGGAAPEPMAAMVEDRRRAVAALTSWVSDRREAAARAEQALVDLARATLGRER